VPKKVECPTRGCTVELYEPGFSEHLKQAHDACSCGWAGTRFKQHAAQRLRRWSDGGEDPGEGVHELINMEFDEDLARWVRVSGKAS
jgi:hypothetical protein